MNVFTCKTLLGTIWMAVAPVAECGGSGLAWMEQAGALSKEIVTKAWWHKTGALKTFQFGQKSTF